MRYLLLIQRDFGLKGDAFAISFLSLNGLRNKLIGSLDLFRRMKSVFVWLKQILLMAKVMLEVMCTLKAHSTFPQFILDE